MEPTQVTIKNVTEVVNKFVDIIGYALIFSVHEIPENGLFKVEMIGDNLGALIGYHGKNIASLEYILNIMLSKKYGGFRHIQLDINGYREARYDTIKKYVESAIKYVQETHKDKDLYPMTSSERLMVHNFIKEFGGLETISNGEEPNRYITIKFKG